MDSEIYSAVAAGIAIGAPLVALITARVGLGGRIRALTYHEKRFALITTMLSGHARLLSDSRIKALRAEVDSIAQELIAMTPQERERDCKVGEKRTGGDACSLYRELRHCGER